MMTCVVVEMRILGIPLHRCEFQSLRRDRCPGYLVPVRPILRRTGFGARDEAWRAERIGEVVRPTRVAAKAGRLGTVLRFMHYWPTAQRILDHGRVSSP